MAFVSCYFMGTVFRGGTVDACFVHNVTYMPVWFILYFVFRTLYGCNPTRGVANKHVSLSLSLSLSLISRKVNLKYFREKIFSRIFCSRENIFPRKYLPAKISSRENIFSRKYPLAKISSRENIFPRFFSVPQICRLVGLGYLVGLYRLFRNFL